MDTVQGGSYDRDPLFTAEFLKTIADAGVESVKLPPRSPNLNAYAERTKRARAAMVSDFVSC
jgi:putative transposase